MLSSVMKPVECGPVWLFLTAFVQLCIWFEGQAGSNGAGPEICTCSHGNLQYINDATASSPDSSSKWFLLYWNVCSFVRLNFTVLRWVIYISVCARARACVCACVCARVCVHACVCACMHACVCHSVSQRLQMIVDPQYVITSNSSTDHTEGANLDTMHTYPPPHHPAPFHPSHTHGTQHHLRTFKSQKFQQSQTAFFVFSLSIFFILFFLLKNIIVNNLGYDSILYGQNWITETRNIYFFFLLLFT